MTLTYVCSSCGFTIEAYRGGRLLEPRRFPTVEEVLKRRGRLCPRCSKPLSEAPLKVVVALNNKGGVKAA